MSFGLPKNNPMRKALLMLIKSVDSEIRLGKNNMVLMVMQLDTREKVLEFNDWLKTKWNGKEITATVGEVMGKTAEIDERYGSTINQRLSLSPEINEDEYETELEEWCKV